MLDHAILSLLGTFISHHHLQERWKRHLDVMGIELRLASTTSRCSNHCTMAIKAVSYELTSIVLLSLAGHLQAESEVLEPDRVGEDARGSNTGGGLQGGQVPFQIRTSLCGQSWFSSVRREIYWLRNDQKHSGEIFFSSASVYLLPNIFLSLVNKYFEFDSGKF